MRGVKVTDRWTDILMVETAAAALRSRAYDYLKKPVRLEELQACIQRVARNHHKGK